jgi:hypothetical protein
MSKTAKIRLDTVKDEGWGEVIQKLGLDEATARRHFMWSEYASLELEIDETLRIVGGRVLPHREKP